VSGSGSGRDGTAELERRQAQVKLVIVLVQLAVIAWMLVPSHARQRARMRMAQSSRRLLASCAERSGNWAMGLELATGARSYTVTELLSRGRDKMAEAYDRAREAG
jgi:hypothetical protein